MEYLDILTPAGEPTGESKPRKEVHRDGDWHRAVHAWIMNSAGELLIQRRAPEKESNPHKWDVSAAGHVSAGETSLEAVVKETREELGVDLPATAFRHLFTVRQSAHHRSGTFIDNEFHDVYLIQTDLSLAAFTVQPGEVAELRYEALTVWRGRIEAGAEDCVSHPEEYARLFTALAQA
jgi:isopentenyldiphosphate isomerase